MTFSLYWCWVVRAALRAGPEWTWASPGNPVRLNRNTTIVGGIFGAIWGLGLAIAGIVLFAR